MAQGRFELVGGRQLRKQLKAAGVDLENLREAHRDAAKIAEDTAAALAPVRTGNLVHSLRSTGTKTAGIVRAGNATIPYAKPIHWGWPARGITRNPFISKGAQASEPRWLPIFAAALDDALDQIKGM